jgi:hypothetical protein
MLWRRLLHPPHTVAILVMSTNIAMSEPFPYVEMESTREMLPVTRERTKSATRFITAIGENMAANAQTYSEFFSMEKDRIRRKDPEYTALKEKEVELLETLPATSPEVVALREEMQRVRLLLSAGIKENVADQEERVARIERNLQDEQNVREAILPVVVREMERFNVISVAQLPTQVVLTLMSVVRRALER